MNKLILMLTITTCLSVGWLGWFSIAEADIYFNMKYSRPCGDNEGLAK